MYICSLEKEMATHFQYFCLKNPMGKGAWQPMALQESDMT